MATDSGLRAHSDSPAPGIDGDLSAGHVGGWWRERRAELTEAIAAAKRAHGSIEGKIGIYGSLFFAVCTLSFALLTAAIMPRVSDAKAQRADTIKIPCEAHHVKYLFGIRIWVDFGGGNVSRYTICRDIDDGRWVAANDQIKIKPGDAD